MVDSPILPSRSGPSTLSLPRQALIVALDKARAKRGPEVTQNQIILKWLQQKGILAVTWIQPESSLIHKSSSFIVLFIFRFSPRPVTNLSSWCRTSSKESRIKEYAATDALADLAAEEIEEIEESCEGVYYRQFVSCPRCLLSLSISWFFHLYFSLFRMADTIIEFDCHSMLRLVFHLFKTHFHPSALHFVLAFDHPKRAELLSLLLLLLQ